MTQEPDPYSVNAPSAPPPPAAPPPANFPPPGGTPPLEYVKDGAYMGPPPNQDDKTMAMLCHLLGIFTGFIGPLVIWLMKKETSPFVDDQGKEALNWHITLVIGFIVSAILAIVVIGFFLMAALAICNVIFCIMGTIKANEGVAYRYPFAIRLLK